MLNYELRHDDGILVLHPQGPLAAADFTAITGQVDNYMEGHGKLHGVLIHTKSFPGWTDFSALLAHMRFLKGHLDKIEKVAVVADGALANIIPKIAGHFIHAQVQHFDFDREANAWKWLCPGSNRVKV
ncbi:MAG TPA: STAS/SEC14 domain-containing protein [Gallionella sp.]|nr:STAS/SEC14 domain-containing protein [Gallionella sp.]